MCIGLWNGANRVYHSRRFTEFYNDNNDNDVVYPILIQ